MRKRKCTLFKLGRGHYEVESTQRVLATIRRRRSKWVVFGRERSVSGRRCKFGRCDAAGQIGRGGFATLKAARAYVCRR